LGTGALALCGTTGIGCSAMAHGAQDAAAGFLADPGGAVSNAAGDVGQNVLDLFSTDPAVKARAHAHTAFALGGLAIPFLGEEKAAAGPVIDAAGAAARDAASGLAGGLPITLEQAAAAATRNGIDMRMFDLVSVADPRRFGFISTIGRDPARLVRTATGRIQLSITDLGLQSERDAVETIAHELNHVRGVFNAGIQTTEDAAEIAAGWAGLFFK
jgi:hypothetical protein